MKRTRIFVRLSRFGEARAEGGIATVVLGLAAGAALWVVSRWDEAVLNLIGIGLTSGFSLIRSFLAEP
jgi:hypothetical protein